MFFYWYIFFYFEIVIIISCFLCSKIMKMETTINAEKSGDVRISGRNLIFDAKDNIEFTANGKVQINSRELIATNQTTTRINAKKTRISGTNLDLDGGTNIVLKTPKGSIKVKKIIGRDVDWAAACFAGTSVGGDALTGGGVNRRGSGVR